MSLLKRAGDSFWLAEGPTLRAYGFFFPTRMAVVRLTSGALWIWSPIRLDGALRDELRRLGEPRYAVEPNKLHHLALAEWVETWPSIRLYAPPGLARKRRDLSFVAELTDAAPYEWRAEIDQVVVNGSFALTEVLFFHRASSTCLVGDLIEMHDEPGLRRWQRWMVSAGGVGREGGTARPWRWTFVRRRLARDAVSHAVAWSPRQLVIAHGQSPIEEGGCVLRERLRWLR